MAKGSVGRIVWLSPEHQVTRNEHVKRHVFAHTGAFQAHATGIEGYPACELTVVIQRCKTTESFANILVKERKGLEKSKVATAKRKAKNACDQIDALPRPLKKRKISTSESSSLTSDSNSNSSEDQNGRDGDDESDAAPLVNRKKRAAAEKFAERAAQKGVANPAAAKNVTEPTSPEKVVESPTAEKVGGDVEATVETDPTAASLATKGKSIDAGQREEENVQNERPASPPSEPASVMVNGPATQDAESVAGNDVSSVSRQATTLLNSQGDWRASSTAVPVRVPDSGRRGRGGGGRGRGRGRERSLKRKVSHDGRQSSPAVLSESEKGPTADDSGKAPGLPRSYDQKLEVKVAHLQKALEQAKQEAEANRMQMLQYEVSVHTRAL